MLSPASSPVANLPADDKRLLEQRPSTGRNTRLGRKVEKPMDPLAGGPSGQKDTSKHNKGHTNK